MVEIASLESCAGYKGREIRIGDTVWTPAGSSDPAAGKVVAILPTDWPHVDPTVRQLSCLIAIHFGDDVYMYCLDKAENCE